MNTIFNITNSPLSGLKRKVEWHGLTILRNENEIRLYTECKFYENLSGTTYGNEINTLEIKPFERILYAKNNNKVNPITGIICNPIFSGGTDVWIDMMGNVSLTCVGQYDYFIHLMDESIILSEIIEAIVISEDQIYNTYDK